MQANAGERGGRWPKAVVAVAAGLLLTGCGLLDPIFGCEGGRPSLQEGKLTVTQGAWGQIRFWEGNFMPGEGCSSGRITGVQRTVLFYELTADSLVTHPFWGPFASEVRSELVDSVRSDRSGFFEINLAPGRYSMFVREDSLLYANLWIDDDVYPVTVDAGAATAVTFDITYKAAY